MNEFKEKAELIEQILDKLMPIPKDVQREVKESMDSDRQRLVITKGFNQMSIEELKEKLFLERCPVHRFPLNEDGTCDECEGNAHWE